jgi:hypothetical protein
VRPAQPPEPPEPPEPPVPDDNTFLPGGPPDGVVSGIPGGVQGGVQAGPQGGVRDGVTGTVTRRSERSESTFTMVSTDDNNKLSIRGRGRIEFTDDDADVKSLTPGGYLDIEQTTRDGTVRVEFQAQPNGAIQRRWWKNGHEAGFEPEGRAWLKIHLVEILRRSGLDAEARVDRLLRTNGPQAVLAEASLCPSDYVKRVYLTRLLSAQHLDPLTLTSLLTQVNREIKSNYDRRVVLVAVTVHRLPNDDARLTYVDATRGMRSDYDRRVTLEALLKAERLAPPVLRAVLASTMEMHSAYDGRTVLERIVETQQLPGDLRQLYIDAADKLRSDYDRSRALSALSRNETAAR